MIKTLQARVVFQNRFVTVYDNDVQFPDGSAGTYFRTRWNAPHGVAIVPVCDEKVILLENYRYAELGWSVEIPQGFGTKGSKPRDDALRELREETGFEATAIEPLLTVGHDYVTHAFIATIPDVEPSRKQLEHSESVRRYLSIAIDEIAPTRLAALGVHDAMTLACLLALRVRQP